jgi:hypothetical protein
MRPSYTLRRVERETLLYASGERSVNIGTYGAWTNGSTVNFVINNRWNPPRSGPVLQAHEIASIEAALRNYGAQDHIIPVITVDSSAA